MSEKLKKLHDIPKNIRTPSQKRQITKTVNILEIWLSNKNVVYDKGCKVPAQCAVNGYSMIKCL